MWGDGAHRDCKAASPKAVLHRGSGVRVPPASSDQEGHAMTIRNRGLTLEFCGARPRANARAVLIHMTAAIGIAIAAATISSGAAAEEPFGEAIGVADLTTLRGGDDTNSHNVTNTSTSAQETTAMNQNNSITAGGDVIAGAIQVDSGAFTEMHGMSNVVMNTAPMANVQGIMSLNLVLH